MILTGKKTLKSDDQNDDTNTMTKTIAFLHRLGRFHSELTSVWSPSLSEAWRRSAERSHHER